MNVTIRVPATSGNLGPGFDILAVALQLQLTMIAGKTDDGRVLIDGEDHSAAPDQHLIARAYVHACDALRIPPAQRGIDATVSSEIPEARGLGSSAAAVIAGILAATSLHRAPWDEKRVLAEATVIEGHPDNAAAALYGGLTICGPGAITQRIDVPDDLRAILFIPDFELPTEKAREVVPHEFSRDDAIFNASRIALLIRAITCHDYRALPVAMEDRWHQQQRAALMPWLPAMIDAARAADAGAALSGAGPTVIALAARDPDPVIAAMRGAAHNASITGDIRVVALRNFGTRVDLKP